MTNLVTYTASISPKFPLYKKKVHEFSLVPPKGNFVIVNLLSPRGGERGCGKGSTSPREISAFMALEVVSSEILMNQPIGKTSTYNPLSENFTI